MTDLSGRVDLIEDNIISINQAILQRPDISSFRQYQIGHEQELDTIEASYASLLTNYKALANLYINLNNNYETYYAQLTGHIDDTTIHESNILTVINITGDYTAFDTDDLILVDTTNGDITVTLPFVSGKQYTIKKTDNAVNSVIITGSATFDGTGSIIFTGQYDVYSVVADATYWNII